MAGSLWGRRVTYFEAETCSARVATLRQVHNELYKAYIYLALTQKIEECVMADKKKQSGWYLLALLPCVRAC